MKKLGILLVLVPLFLVGCAIEDLYDRTSTVTDDIINYPQSVTVSNTPAGPIEVVTPAYSITNRVTNWVYTPKPAFEGAILGAETISGLVPTPWSQILAIAFGSVLPIMGWFARRANKEKAEYRDLFEIGVDAIDKYKTDSSKAPYLHAKDFSKERRLKPLLDAKLAETRAKRGSMT